MKKQSRLNYVVTVSISIVLMLSIFGGNFGCTRQQKAREKATKQAANRIYYTMKNDIEYKNYSQRQRLADDPTTVLWCTAFPPIIGAKPFTVPVVGKLTSGGKRPYQTNNNQAGPDAMYGHSGEYRFGFTPAGFYADYYNLPLYCTDEPTIWQSQNTIIAMQPDPKLLAAHKEARKILREGLINKNQFTKEAAGEAYKVLSEAIEK